MTWVLSIHAMSSLRDIRIGETGIDTASNEIEM